MKRRLFNLLAAVSLVLCVAIATFWIRSHSIGDSLKRYYDPSDFEILSNDGLVAIAWGKLHSEQYPPHAGWEGSFWPFTRDSEYMSANLPKIARHYWMGFGFDHWTSQSPGYFQDTRGIVFPYWLLCISTTGIFAFCARRSFYLIRAARRATAGLCVGCGYDLRTSKERCPECGTAILTRANTS